jgi:SAM-dependent methyltransferase
VKSDYATIWDTYYKRLLKGGQFKPFWEVSPEDGVAHDFELFETYFDNSLPIIDFGCGTGIQTSWLGEKYEKVVGVDVSESIILEARAKNKNPHIQYEVLDISDPAGVRRLHEQYGDCNIYIRGVLHQIRPSDHKGVAEGLGYLIGEIGRIFIYEVADNIRSYIQEHENNFKTWPPIMQRIFLGKLPPKGVSESMLRQIFTEPDFVIDYCDKTFLKTRLQFGERGHLNIPCVRALIT